MIRHTARRTCSAVLSALTLLVVATPARAQMPTEPPPATPLRALQFPPFREAELRNGLELVLVEDHDLPIVSISLSIPTGAVNDPPGMRGLASMVAELLTKGTTSRTAEEIAAAIEGVGGSLNASAGNDFFTVSTTVLTEHADLAVELLSDVVLNATFPEEELELARTRALSALRLEKSDPGAIADRYFMRAVYGEHPYGLRETETSVEAITAQAVRHFAQEQLRPDGTLLVIAGDLTLDQARNLARRHLGEWRGRVPARSYGSPPVPRPTEILLVHRPGSEQSNIMVGNLGIRARDPNAYPARVFNRVLGGGADARLFLILREEKGWTYGSYSSVNSRYDVGTFEATAEVRTNVTDSALVEMLHQLRRVRTELIPDSELTNAKAYLTGVFPLTIQTPQQVAGQVSQQKRMGLGDDYLERYRERLASVNAGQAREAAARLIQPDSAVIVVVGDGGQIYDKLTPIAPVRIIDVDGNPLTPDDLVATASEVAYDHAQLQPRRDSLHITVQGNVFGGMVTQVVQEEDALVYTSQTAVPLMGMNQETRVRMDAATLEVRSVDQAAQLQGQSGETHLTVRDDRITGHAQTPQPGGVLKEADIDTALSTGLLVTDQIQVLMPALPLAQGESFTLNVLDTEDGSIKPYTITVDGVEEVVVPAGTFSSFRLSVAGGDENFTFYVSQEPPRRIVKWEIVGQPVVFELVQIDD